MSTADAQSLSRLQNAAFDYGSIKLPFFVARQGEELLVFNRTFAEYIGADTAHRTAMPISDLELRANRTLRPAIREAMERGEAVVIDDVVFRSESGDGKYCSINLIPLVTSNEPEIAACIGLILDLTRSRILEQRLKLVQNELSIVSQVAAQLGSMMETEEIFKIILIAITAREGLGFNRAFIFLLNGEQTELLGHHAIGPMDAEEAGRIWHSIPDEGKDLRTVIRSYRRSIDLDKIPLDRAIRSIRYRIADNPGPLVDSITSRTPARITDHRDLAALSDEVGKLFGATELAVAPLFSKSTVLGVVAADNLITGRAISDSHLDQLQMFASQGAIAFERARLYENLQANVKMLESTNRRLERTQKEVIRIERFSLMGEITYRIAHELRNPLTIIGGFASLLLKTDGMSRTARERAAVISKECSRLEKQLEVLLDFSRSYSQEKEDVDLGMMIDDLVGMLQPRFRKSGAAVSADAAGCAVVVHAHKDQLLHGLYNTVAVLTELSSDHSVWRMSAVPDAGGAKGIEINPDENTMSKDEAVSVLRRFVHGRAGTSDLRLSLAGEAISYNGGEFGFVLDGDRPGIRITFEL